MSLTNNAVNNFDQDQDRYKDTDIAANEKKPEILPKLDPKIKTGIRALKKSLSTKIDLDYNLFAAGFLRFELSKSKKDVLYITPAGFYIDGFRDMLVDMGFYKLYRPGGNEYELIHVENNIIEITTIDRIRSLVYRVLKNHLVDLKIEHKGTAAVFSKALILDMFTRQQDNLFKKADIELLPGFEKDILKDTKEESFIAFKNGIVTITKDLVEFSTYSKFDRFAIWRSHIKPHDYNEVDPSPTNCKFLRFLFNVCNQEETRLNAFKSALGYLIHSYNSSALGYSIVLNDEKIRKNGESNGNTGKGVVLQSVRLIRDTLHLDGKTINLHSNFAFQGVNDYTQIISIDDIKENFPFEKLFSVLTDGITVEKKYKGQERKKISETPKMVISSNHPIDGNTVSFKKRIFNIELSDYYSSKTEDSGGSPIVDELGYLFLEDFPDSEWDSFYCFMILCAQYYLKNGMVQYERKNISQNRVIQHCKEWGEAFAQMFFDRDWEVGKKYATKQEFNDFVEGYLGGDAGTLQQRQFTEFIRYAGREKSWELEVKPSNGISYFWFKPKQ